MSTESFCRKCGAPLTSDNWTASYAKHNNRICSSCNSLYNLTKRPRFEKECIQCHVKFTTTHKEAKFCSHECQHVNSVGKKKPATSIALAEFYSEHPKELNILKERLKSTQFTKGHEVPDEWREKMKPWEGKTFDEETKSNMSTSHITFNFEHPEVKASYGAAHKGPDHWNWKGGISGEMKLLRSTPEYNEWRKSVYRRDNFTCQDCGSKDDIIAHHLKSFNDYPEFRFSVDNGVTLCRPCHKKRHSDIGLETRFQPQ